MAESDFDKIGSVMELQDFRLWLENNTSIMPSSRYMYFMAAKKFLNETHSITDPNAYNAWLMKYCIKKRSNWYYFGLVHYVKFKYGKKEDKDLCGSILEAMKYVKPPILESQKVVSVLDNDSIDRIINGVKRKKHQVIARLQKVTGARVGDIMRLKKGDIVYEVFKDRIVMALNITGKGKKRYKMWVFDEEVQSETELFIKGVDYGNDFYFIEKDNPYAEDFLTYKVNYSNFLDDLKLSMMKSGVDYKKWAAHDFRRNVARIVYEKYKDLVLLQKVLHHSDFGTTVRYLKHMALEVQNVQEELYAEGKLGK